MSKSTAKIVREESKKKTGVWMLLDSTGESTILDVDKHAIMQSVRIHGRDLRILDPLLSYPSTILGRDQAIVLNLEHLKAIITAEEMLLRDPMDDNVIPIVEQLRKHLPLVNTSPALGDTETHEEREFPFEFRVLEAALETICTFLDTQTTELETAAYPALDDLTSKISSRNLDRVLKLKSVMTRLTARVQKIRDELEQLLDDDDDMSDLYLSRKLVGSSSPISGSGAHNSVPTSSAVGSKISRVGRGSAATIRENEDDVEELEMLLEAYFIQIDGTLNKLTTLREFINDTEDYINIQLENRRNQLIQLSLFINSGTVSITVFSFVCGIFGVNIPYNWNDGHAYLFKWVLLVTGMCSTFIFIVIIFLARRKGLVGS